MTIDKIENLAEYYGVSVTDLKKSIYDGTECGAWIEWDASSVSIGSIVEGSDAEFSCDFSFPFESSEVENWIEELESLCSEAWHEANDD